jgi:hypothetical protein
MAFGISTAQAANPEPIGANCRLSAPPADAGESPDHGVAIRIYPRARDISSSYTGCQTLWAPQKEAWVRISVTELVKGDPIRVWTPAGVDDAMNACRYEKGKTVSGDARSCPAPAFLIQQSFPPGCTAKLLAAKGGPVSGCDLD